VLLARYPLPDIPALSAAEKWVPTTVALPFGDALLAVFGANTGPMTVARFAAGAAELVREYPDVDTNGLFAAATQVEPGEAPRRERARALRRCGGALTLASCPPLGHPEAWPSRT
jgi:hypothetical protein